MPVGSRARRLSAETAGEPQRRRDIRADDAEQQVPSACRCETARQTSADESGV